jgi:hypothetical protein
LRSGLTQGKIVTYYWVTPALLGVFLPIAKPRVSDYGYFSAENIPTSAA